MFGASIGAAGTKRLCELDRQMVGQGVPSSHVDILNFVGKNEFKETWNWKVLGRLAGVSVFFPSKADLIEMKVASGSKHDLPDIERLEKSN